VYIFLSIYGGLLHQGEILMVYFLFLVVCCDIFALCCVFFFFFFFGFIFLLVFFSLGKSFCLVFLVVLLFCWFYKRITTPLLDADIAITSV